MKKTFILLATILSISATTQAQTIFDKSNTTVIKNNKSKYYTYNYENNHMLNLDTICILTYINMQYIMNYKQKKVMIDILKLDKKHIK